MPHLTKNYNLYNIFVLIGIFVFSSNLGYSEGVSYNQDFELTGNILIVGEGQFNFNGIMSIESKALNQQLEYILIYEAVLPSSIEHGTFYLTENIDTKLMNPHQMIEDDFIFDFLWNVFSDDGKNELYSIFRIVESEVEQEKFQILNFTTNSHAEEGFYTPFLNYQINAIKLVIEVSSSSLILYYDTQNLILIGFKSTISSNDIGPNGATGEIIATIKSTTLDLPRRADPIWDTYLRIFFGILILIPVSILSYRRFFVKTIRMEGGLEV